MLLVSFASLGWRGGIVVAAAVPLTLAAVFVIMMSTDRVFDRITLGVLILALGLLVQGAFLEPQDIPQFGMNVTTLLVPLFALVPLANRIIRVETPYTELRYAQVLTLSTAYQSGVVLWVAFWALYGGGATLENMAAIGTFAGSYVVVVLIEPVLDVAVLALAKSLRPLRDSLIVTPRLHHGGN